MKLFNKSSDNSPKAEMSFADHIDELRSHLFRSAIAITIGAVFIGINNKFITQKVLMGPTHKDFLTYRLLCKLGQRLGLGSKLCMEEMTLKLQSNTVAGEFGVFVNIILIGGIVVAFPYVFYQFWKFVKPALTTKELRNTTGVIFWVSVLFFLGTAFGYFVIAPYTINFFANFTLDDNIENKWTIMSYFNTIVPLILGAGLAFQLPLVMFFLAKINVVSAGLLRKGRRYAILGIVILASIITPPDMLSTIIVSIPIYFLYEISILLCSRAEKKKKKVEEEWS